MTDESLDSQLELFYGGANVNSATVYARLRDQPTGKGLSLAGFIRGPRCLFSTMLPATIKLADAGPGDSLLAKTVVPDPCYWTPELPALYDVHVELKRDGQIIAAADRTFGMRQFGPRGRFLYQNGKRWTVRAAQPADEPGNLLDWHDTPLSLCVTNPTDAFCDEASRSGVMIIALLESAADDLVSAVRRLARHVAVAIIAIDARHGLTPLVPTLPSAAPNVVMAHLIDVHDASFKPTGDVVGAQAIVARVRQPEVLANAMEAMTVPILAWRTMEEGVAAPQAARDKCDQLQAALAPFGDFAGYIV